MAEGKTVSSIRARPRSSPAENKQHESLGHKVTHPFHHHKDERAEAQQSSDGKTHQGDPNHPEHKKEGLIHRMEDYAKKENVKEVRCSSNKQTLTNSVTFKCRTVITSGVGVRMSDNGCAKVSLAS